MHLHFPFYSHDFRLEKWSTPSFASFPFRQFYVGLRTESMVPNRARSWRISKQWQNSTPCWLVPQESPLAKNVWWSKNGSRSKLRTTGRTLILFRANHFCSACLVRLKLYCTSVFGLGPPGVLWKGGPLSAFKRTLVRLVCGVNAKRSNTRLCDIGNLVLDWIQKLTPKFTQIMCLLWKS